MQHPDLPPGFMQKRQKNKTQPLLAPTRPQPEPEPVQSFASSHSAPPTHKIWRLPRPSNSSVTQLETADGSTQPAHSSQAYCHEARQEQPPPAGVWSRSRSRSLFPSIRHRPVPKSESSPDSTSLHQIPHADLPDSLLTLQEGLDLHAPPSATSQPLAPDWLARSARKGEIEPQTNSPSAVSLEHSMHDMSFENGPGLAIYSASVTGPRPEQATHRSDTKRRFLRPAAVPSNSIQQAQNHKSHIHQFASRSPVVLGRSNHADAGLSPPVSPDPPSTHGARVNNSSPQPGSSSRSTPVVDSFPSNHVISLSRWQSSSRTPSLRSSYSAVSAESTEPAAVRQSSAIMSDTRSINTESGQPGEAITTDATRTLSPLSSHPASLSSQRTSANLTPTASQAVRDTPKSFSRPDLNQHLSLSRTNAPANQASPPLRGSSVSPIIYAHSNVSDISSDISMPSPILEHRDKSDSGISAMDTFSKDANHHDVSPIDENDHDGEFPPWQKQEGNTKRAQELQRRWMATKAPRR